MDSPPLKPHLPLLTTTSHGLGQDSPKPLSWLSCVGICPWTLNPALGPCNLELPQLCWTLPLDPCNFPPAARPGHLAPWTVKKAPELAQLYWSLPQGATMRDLILAIRADEVRNDYNFHHSGCDSSGSSWFCRGPIGEDLQYSSSSSSRV